MPLVRYEIPNEFRIANPIVYKDVPKDDAVALLEGITMSALAGTVRQLGELSEFAAEVFGGLHEEILALSSRERVLCTRVEDIESKLPEIERLGFAEDDQLKYASTPGLEWHSGNCIDQSHFSQGVLPPFIQKSYEECAGPPSFYKVDKFDVAGPGATLRRYTNPSFFRTEWANSQLLKAEKVRRVCKEKKQKQKPQAAQTASKESLKASKFIRRVDSFKYPYEEHPPNVMQAPRENRSQGSPTLKISAVEIEASTRLRKTRPESDRADSPDQFVDALATIEPETDRDISEKLAEAWNLDAKNVMDKKPSMETQQAQVLPDNGTGLRTPPRVVAGSSSSGSNSDSPVSETSSSEETDIVRKNKATQYSSTCSFSSPESVDSRSAGQSISSTVSEDHSVHQAFSALDSPMSPVGKFESSLEDSIFQSMKKLRPDSPTSSPVSENFEEKMPPLPPSKWIMSRSPPVKASKVVRIPTPPPLPSLENGRLHKSPGEVVSEHRDLLLDSITSHSMDKLRKVGTHTRARSRSLDSRDELLEQIRTGSFNLKHPQSDTTARPPAMSSPADVNVAAILEKASAIRQALEGSDDDEEEDWAH